MPYFITGTFGHNRQKTEHWTYSSVVYKADRHACFGIFKQLGFKVVFRKLGPKPILELLRVVFLVILTPAKIRVNFHWPVRRGFRIFAEIREFSVWS